MKCYIWETPSWIYDISRDKRPWTKEVECTAKDIQELIDIPMGHLTEIQQKINYILYASQLNLPWINHDTN